MVQDFDRAILGMLEDGTLSILRNTYINTPVSDSCGSSLSTDSNSLAFGQMAGLWCGARAMPASSQILG